MAAAPSGSGEQVAGLRADLREAGYTVAGLDDLLGPSAGGALVGGQRLPADRLTRGNARPPAVLVRLLVLGLPVAADAVAAVLPRTGLAGVLEMGLSAKPPVVRLSVCVTCARMPMSGTIGGSPPT